MLENLVWFSHKPQQLFETKKIQNYVFSSGDLLGKGNFSKVYCGTHELTGQIVAIKVVQLNSMKSPALVQLLYSEIEVLKTLKHTNILNCIEVFVSANNCYMITQVCNEGDLEGKLRKSGFIQEPFCRKFFFDIYQGLKYLAEQNIIHRDIKVANIFLKNGSAKIADFGFAKRTTQHFKDINIGSPIYMSPQGLLQGIYGPKTDVWAFGVLMYEMTQAQTHLAFCKSQAELKYHIKIPLTADRFKRPIPNQLKDLILRCLDINQPRRIGMKQIQYHPYMKALYGLFNKQSSIQQNSFNETNLRNLQRGYSPSNHSSILRSQQQQIRGRSFDPTFESSRQNMVRQNSPPRSFVKNELTSNTTMSYYANQNISPPTSNITINSQPQHQSYQQPSQNFSLNSTQNILVSKIKFQQSVYLLHYCRLIYKFLKQPSNLKIQPLKQNLTNWLLDCISQIQRKISTHVEFTGSKATQRQQKTKDVVKQYSQKYNKQLKRTNNIQPTLTHINQLLVKALQNNTEQANQKSDLIAINYLVTILEANRALETAIQTSQYKQLVEKVNIQSFLSSNEKSIKTFRGENVKNHAFILIK